MEIKQYGAQAVEILREEPCYQGYFQLKKVVFRHKLFSGEMSGKVSRELFVKGAAATLIAYDPWCDSVVLVEQFRLGAYEPNSEKSPWLLELIAGMIDRDETPEEVAIRESQEEAGISVLAIYPALSLWDSPGATVERQHFFLGIVDSTQAHGVHGLEEENEDIRVHVLARETAYEWVENGRIDNALAVIGLQWLQLHYRQYQQLHCSAE